ncbi:MAG: signal recognition particle-docking protein FtsY [Acidimicrobiia bacterium]
MEVVLIFVLIVAVIGVLLFTAAGVSRRTRRRADEIAKEFGSGGTATLPPLPAELPPEGAIPPPTDLEAPPVEVPAVGAVEAPEAPEAPVAPPEAPSKPKLRDRLGKTRAVFAGLLGRSVIDDDTWDELEETLLLADVGVNTSTALVDRLRARVKAEKVTTADGLFALLRAELLAMLQSDDRSLHAPAGKLNVWMFVGVNGVGKTTTIAKLGQREVDAGKKVILAAGDTFRAAASDQLAHWADRVGAEIVRGQDGADPGSVLYDAMDAANSRGADVLLVDTAGRLHTKTNLMEELKKLRRIVDKTQGALEEVLLVIDASTGQNGLAQARQFTEAVDVTGVVLTKLDGTAKGGIVLAIQHELQIPVKVVGVGEGSADLIEFNDEEFVDALLARD